MYNVDIIYEQSKIIECISLKKNNNRVYSTVSNVWMVTWELYMIVTS